MMLEKRRSFHAGLWGLACVAMLLPSPPAGAQVYNGDFEAAAPLDPLDGWFANATPGATVSAETAAVQGHEPVMARLTAEDTWTWQDGAGWVGGDYQQAFFAQGLISGRTITLYPDDFILRFDALVSVSGQGLGNAATMTAIAYGTESGSWVQTIVAGEWTTIEVPLTDQLPAPIPAGVMLDVMFVVNLGAPVLEGAEGEQVTQSARLWLDNVALGPAMAPPIPGDTNGDGQVDREDLMIAVRNMHKTPAGPTDGDWNDDNVVNGKDVAIIARLMHQDNTPGNRSVPEPATLSLLALGGAALLRRKARPCVRP